MAWKLKNSIFGKNFDIDIETSLPLQELYSFMLKRKWGKREDLDKRERREFITFALRYLPKESYVIFFFGTSSECFIQFANYEGDRVLDMPLIKGNVFYGKAGKLAKLLHSENIEEGAWSEGISSKPNIFYTVPLAKGQKSINVDLGNDYEKAADLALTVAEKICRLKKPVISNFESGNMAYRE